MVTLTFFIIIYFFRRFKNLSGSHLQSQVNCGTSVGTSVGTSLVVNLIGQRSPDVIGRLSVSRDVIGCEDCKK